MSVNTLASADRNSSPGTLDKLRAKRARLIDDQRPLIFAWEVDAVRQRAEYSARLPKAGACWIPFVCWPRRSSTSPITRRVIDRMRARGWPSGTLMAVESPVWRQLPKLLRLLI